MSTVPPRWLAAFFLFALGSWPSAAHAQTGLKLQLVSEQSAIIPGKPFTVGLWLDHDRGAHTYWRFPGIVGVPTQLQWNLPKGWKASELIYPEPERTLMFQIKAQGYERDVVLPIRITPPADLKDGSMVKLSGKASWMCCNQECNPGFQDLVIELPVKHSNKPAYDTEWRPKFERERSLRPSASQAWQASAEESEKIVSLTLEPKAKAAKISAEAAAKIIFFTEDGLIDSNKPQVVRVAADGTITFTLIKADFILGDKPTHLNGLLLHPPGWLADGSLRCLRVSPALTPAQ
jgi:thiol:disulfide interchange protein DsbD